MNIRSGLLRRAPQPVHAEHDLVLRRVLGQVARDDALVAAAPARAAVVGQPHAGGGDADGEPVRVAGPCRDRVQAQAPAARLPLRPPGMLPQAAVELQLAPPSRLSNSTPGSPPAYTTRRPRRARSPRSARARVAAGGQRDALGLLPFAAGSSAYQIFGP